jgi:crotonobetainyl-CoA:carnitine CoA-transferase CaiB-like acyl-CoA transferase
MSLQETIGGFFLHRTKADLFEEGVKRRIDIYPVADSADITTQVQLRERHFWVDVPHPELGVNITYPGPFVKLSETPIEMRRRAPLIGEHNREIYVGELGFSEEQLYALTEGGVI